MGSIHLRRVGALVFALALALGACSGGPGGGPTGDPAGSVTNALAAVSSGGVAKLADFACAAHKNDLANAFTGTSAAALAAAGLNANDLFNAMTLSFTNVSAKEVSKTDTTAKVHVSGDMKISFDREKFKTILKTMLSAQGMPTDDATINAALTGMSAQLEKTQKIDEDIAVVNEGGKWLLCE